MITVEKTLFQNLSGNGLPIDVNAIYSNLNELFPEYINKTLKEGIIDFDKKIHGFATPDAILTGVETRSSAPITILRNDELESSEKNLYPCGEGAGYAGGITTAAIDGIKIAKKIIEKIDS